MRINHNSWKDKGQDNCQLSTNLVPFERRSFTPPLITQLLMLSITVACSYKSLI